MTKKVDKKFDAVTTMREIRKRLSRQIEGMTFEEEKRFIRERLPRRTVRQPGKPPKKPLQPASLQERGGGQRRTAKATRG